MKTLKAIKDEISFERFSVPYDKILVMSCQLTVTDDAAKLFEAQFKVSPPLSEKPDFHKIAKAKFDAESKRTDDGNEMRAYAKGLVDAWNDYVIPLQKKNSEKDKQIEELKASLDFEVIYNKLIEQHNEWTNVHPSATSDEWKDGYGQCMSDLSALLQKNS